MKTKRSEKTAPIRVFRGALNVAAGCSAGLRNPRRALPFVGCEPRHRLKISELGDRAAFTLLELLVVIAIVGILAAIAVPTMNSFKPNVMAAATQQLLGDIARARQLALSERTTVYMVFVPTNFWNDPAFAAGFPTWPQVEKDKAQRLYDKQLVGYNFVALRSLGDQPGRNTPRYLSSWRTLPEGVFIPTQKFWPRNPLLPALRVYTNDPTGTPLLAFPVLGFQRTTDVPFPSELTPPAGTSPKYTSLPYLAFNYLGQLVDDRHRLTGTNELISLAKGSILFGRDPATKQALNRLPSALESPPGNTTNSSFHLLNVDWLTGRARVERQEIQ